MKIKIDRVNGTNTKKSHGGLKYKQIIQIASCKVIQSATCKLFRSEGFNNLLDLVFISEMGYFEHFREIAGTVFEIWVQESKQPLLIIECRIRNDTCRPGADIVFANLFKMFDTLEAEGHKSTILKYNVKGSFVKHSFLGFRAQKNCYSEGELSVLSIKSSSFNLSRYFDVFH